MSTRTDLPFAGYRYPAEVISTVLWLSFRFPPSLRRVAENLAAQGVAVRFETIRQWGLRFGRDSVNSLRRRAPRRDDKFYLDEVVLTIAAKRETMLGVALRQHKTLNNRAENSSQPTKLRERQMKRFESARQGQRFFSIHAPITNFFSFRRDRRPVANCPPPRVQTFETWAEVAGACLAARR